MNLVCIMEMEIELCIYLEYRVAIFSTSFGSKQKGNSVNIACQSFMYNVCLRFQFEKMKEKNKCRRVRSTFRWFTRYIVNQQLRTVKIQQKFPVKFVGESVCLYFVCRVNYL